MIFGNATEYAIRGISELAARAEGSRILLDDLVAGTNLPRDFMAKILQQLARAGVLTSVKGRGGGFALARSAHQISLMQLVEAIEGPQRVDRCVVGLEVCSDDAPCPQHDLYKPIRQRLRDFMNTTTVADLAASLKTKVAWQANRAPTRGGRASAPSRQSGRR
jgi:Rrf2 family protein